jgi:hypothetical protein
VAGMGSLWAFLGASAGSIVAATMGCSPVIVQVRSLGLLISIPTQCVSSESAVSTCGGIEE